MDEQIKIYLTNKYINLENKYFIHFRKGDYLNCKMLNISLDNYYKKCLNLLPNKSEFLIFSDDIEYCKNIPYLKHKNVNFVINENEINSLYLMSLCKLGGICCNSTFSWWGAYLNNNPEKIVFFPNKWLNNDYKVEIGFKDCKIINIKM